MPQQVVSLHLLPIKFQIHFTSRSSDRGFLVVPRTVCLTWCCLVFVILWPLLRSVDAKYCFIWLFFIVLFLTIFTLVNHFVTLLCERWKSTLLTYRFLWQVYTHRCRQTKAYEVNMSVSFTGNSNAKPEVSTRCEKARSLEKICA